MTAPHTVHETRVTGENPFFTLPVLETERLLLRPMRLSDAEDMYAYASDPVVSRYTVWDAHTSLNDAVAFLRCVLENYQAGTPENWGIELKENGTFIGTCGFFSWDPEHRRGEIQYALGRAYAGKGLMSEAVRRVVRFGFDVMCLHRIEASCMLGNAASERVMQKAGMSFEGIRREAVFAKGRFHDLKSYAIVRDDYDRIYLHR